MRWPEIIDDNNNTQVVVVAFMDAKGGEYELTLNYSTCRLLRGVLCDHFGRDEAREIEEGGER